MAPRLVVLGWDSATFDVIDPLVAAGRLPVIADMGRRGVRAPLQSTWPPMTDCAWTSAFTGRNPGGHGIFGSWYRAPGAYACGYFSSRDRRAPALWELAQSVRFVVWNVPMTFPPDALNGIMVAGYGAPPGSRFCDPPEVQDALAERWALDDLLDRAPHGSLERFLDDLTRGLDAQADALLWIASESDADCVVAVWPHVDRAQHFLWRFRGTDHPLAGTVDRIYEAMDHATGKLVEAWDDADFVVLSDHGAGPLKGDINIGAWLARRGNAAYGARRRSRLVGLAWAMPPALRKLGKQLAPGLARRAFGATLAGQLGSFDWTRTECFAGFHGDLWLNLVGREPAGTVPEERAEPLLDELRAALLELTDPATGAPLFAGAYRRDDIYSGPAAGIAPDLMLDSWSAGYRVAPSREDSAEVVVPPSPLAGVNEAWSSDHRPEGIFVAAGPRIARTRTVPDDRQPIHGLSLYDVCPIALALLGKPVPEGLDGSVPEALLDDEFLTTHPVTTREATPERHGEGEYSEDEAEAVAAHLKDLGYIE